MIDDNEDAPTGPVLDERSSRHRRTGTMPVITPAAELRSTLHDLTDHDVLGRIVRLEIAADAQRLENAVLAASRRTWRWIVGFAVPTLLGGMFALVLNSLDKISAAGFSAGQTKTEIKAHDKLIDLLEAEVAELRRHAGLNKPIVEGRVGFNP